MFDFDYLEAHTEKQLKIKLKTFYEASEYPKILEIFTPRTINDEVLHNYFEFIK